MSERPKSNRTADGGSDQRLVQRRSKLLAATVVAKLVEAWWIDGCPSANDSDDYDIKAYEGEAKRIMCKLDARVTALLTPLNDQGHGRRAVARTPDDG